MSEPTPPTAARYAHLRRLRDRADPVIDWIAGHGWAPITATLLVVLAVWGFVEIAGEVSEGDTQRFDEWAVNALRQPPPNEHKPIGPPWFANVGRDITALGGVAVLTIVTALVCGYLVMSRKLGAAVFVVVAASGGLALSTALKSFFDRERPGVVHLDHTMTSSFPSGHAMLSTTVYLTLGTMLTRLVRGRRQKVFFLAVAIGLSLLIGLSRVYMGVHYPTDVLAGWSAGLAWGLACWVVEGQLQRKGKIEPPASAAVEPAGGTVDNPPPTEPQAGSAKPDAEPAGPL